MEIGISTHFFEFKFCRSTPQSTKEEDSAASGRFGKELLLMENAEFIEGEVLSREHLKMIEKSGIRSIELGPTLCLRGYDKNYLIHLAKRLEEHRINVHSFHEIIYKPISLGSLDEADREYVLAEDEKQINMLRLFNPKIMVVHVVGRLSEDMSTIKRQKEKCKMSLSELVSYCKDRNIKIALENLAYPHYIEYLLELLNDFDSQNVGICLDTGHCHRLGEDLLHILELCKERLITLHISDNHGKGSLDEHLVPYEGTINWEEFGEALATNGYNGIFMYESLNRPNSKEIFWKILNSFSRIKTKVHAEVRNG